MFRLPLLFCAGLLLSLGSELAAQTNTLTYLDESADGYYPGTSFPKLTTPQWVGDEGVDVVITLGIDDLGDTAKYEAYLRPILERLKQIDGRAPVSIMSCKVNPNDPQLQTWLDEGLSIEVHTVDHPCPCLQGSDFAKAKSTYDRCVDTMASIPGNAPVAFRTPCCDSRNTPSPRLWEEIFNRRTQAGNFLQADSSVFTVFTDTDPDLPRELVLDPDGTPRFNKYIPFPSFVNKIQNYPYPYVVGKLGWQFPCMVPSDWEAQNLQQPNNPQTVTDMQAALDATVIKQGMFNLVFHPHGWIRNDQVVQLIDYADKKYGKRVKFLTFKECVDRINHNLLVDQPLRAPKDGGDHGVRIADLNQDGYVDVIIGNETRKTARLWQPAAKQWREFDHDLQITAKGNQGRVDLGVKFGHLAKDGSVSLLVNNETQQGLYQVTDNGVTSTPLPQPLLDIRTSVAGADQGVRLRDLDGDGVSEVIVGNSQDRQILKRRDDGTWQSTPDPMPFAIVDDLGRDNGVRFVDFDKDGHDDVIISNGADTAIQLYDVDTGGFTRRVKDLNDVPLIVREGTNNGVWFAADHMWVQNEDTHRLPDLVDRRSFLELLGRTEPGPRSAELSHQSIQMRPDFEIELVVAEPLVMDPVALDWGPDGKLWVVEMADYPLGLDDKGKPGGRVRYLEDTTGDGQYDKSTLFLDEIPFPTGVMAWRDGVLVCAAPSLFFAADRDGDGKAEVREELYRGFVEGNQQHRFNGITRGLDNWLYLANGDSGGVIESVKTGKKLDIRGLDVRIRPEDGALEAQSGQTQYGRHRDDHGNWFGSNNSIPVRHYVLADHYLRRNPLVAPPAAQRNIARLDNTQVFPVSRVLSHWSGYKPPAAGMEHEFTSACSTTIYRDTLLGADFLQNTFTCEPVHNLVQRRQLTATGVTFESVRPEDEAEIEFLASTDSWFRPSFVTTGPDGALWVTDMYRLVIEHPQWIGERTKELFLRAGHDRGRIYRAYPKNSSPRPILKLNDLAGPALIDQLASPNGRVRDLAQQQLIERNSAPDLARLQTVVRSSTNPLARLHALCTLDGLQMDVETLRIALADTDATVRRHAIRIAEKFIHEPGKVSDRLISALETCDINDPHVRLQLAYSLGASSSTGAINRLAEIALLSAGDLYVQAAVISSLGEHNLRQFRTAIHGKEAAAPYEAAVLEMAVRMQNSDFLAELFYNVIDQGRQETSVENIGELAAALGTVRKRGVALQPDLQKKLADFGAELATLASDPDAEITLRRAAVSVLTLIDAKFRGDVLNLVTSTEPLELQTAAIHALAGQETAALLSRLTTISPTVRSAILDDSMTRESTALQLAEAVRSNTIPLQTIGSEHRQKMTTHVSEKVRAAATELFGDAMSSGDKHALLETYRSVNPADGDQSRGQAIFTQHCATCHRVKGIGNQVGPDLAGLKDRSPKAMVTAILAPNAAVEDKYLSYNVLTLDGVVEAGIITNESTVAIELTMQNGKSKTILRDDIDQVQSVGTSLMPEEFEKVISPSQMSDLLAFLDELGPAPKAFPGNEPITITARDGGTFEMTAAACRIFGDKINFEAKHKNIGFWSDINDRVEWTVANDKPSQYEVWLDYACPANTAGNAFIFTLGEQTLTGTVQSTNGWDDYRQVKLGTITLPQDTSVAVFKADPSLKNWLLDLRGITLKPVAP
ncbi:PVC-type heme-binding CxxCH protein [Novipirellula galeiformis]|nr:PVC-type heme-binding CxxCH protein [Novipirellula galeiformis]